MVLLKLKELYSDWTSNDNEGVFSDFLKAKLQDLQEKTIKKVVTTVTSNNIYYHMEINYCSKAVTININLFS